jgi:mannose-6-phosphate isomerase-like protein (cupin superfamily)
MARDCQPFVVGPREGRSIDLGEFGMTVKAAADETAGAVSVLEAEEPPGLGPPIHVHHDAAEAFYVLEGEYIMYLGDREVVCPAGSFIFIPRGVRHGFRVGTISPLQYGEATPTTRRLRGSRAHTRWKSLDRRRNDTSRRERRRLAWPSSAAPVPRNDA